MIVAAGRRKFSWLQALPYTLARMSEPGYKDNIVEQYDAADPSLHHPLSHHVLRPGSPLRAAVDAIGEDGEIRDPHLWRR